MSPQAEQIVTWLNPGLETSLGPNQLDIWRIDMDQTPCRPAYLGDAERARWERFTRALAKRRYCAAHTGLHQVLGRYLGCPPQQIQLESPLGGKPKLSGNTPPLHFNLTHAQHIALLAVCSSCKVGIDIEFEHALPSNVARIAQRLFHPDEVTRLERSEWDGGLFFHYWTRMEARQKCLGRGVFGKPPASDDVHTLTFTPGKEQAAAIAWPAGSGITQINYLQLPTTTAG